jgi:spore coat protein U-like protein
MRRNSLYIAILLVLMAWPAQAAVVCEVNTAGVAFGNYDTLSGEARDASGTVTVECVGSAGDAVSYALTLSAGSGGYSSRHAAGGASGLEYNLYLDISRSNIWGDGSAGTSVITDQHVMSSTTFSRSYVIYGRAAGGQNQAPAAFYQESLLVSLSY